MARASLLDTKSSILSNALASEGLALVLTAFIRFMAPKWHPAFDQVDPVCRSFERIILQRYMPGFALGLTTRVSEDCSHESVTGLVVIRHLKWTGPGIHAPHPPAQLTALSSRSHGSSARIHVRQLTSFRIFKRKSLSDI